MTCQEDRASILAKMRLDMEETRNRLKAVRESTTSQSQDVQTSQVKREFPGNPSGVSATGSNTKTTTGVKTLDFLAASSQLQQLRDSKEKGAIKGPLSAGEVPQLEKNERLFSLEALQKAVASKRLERETKPRPIQESASTTRPLNTAQPEVKQNLRSQLENFIDALKFFEENVVKSQGSASPSQIRQYPPRPEEKREITLEVEAERLALVEIPPISSSDEDYDEDEDEEEEDDEDDEDDEEYLTHSEESFEYDKQHHQVDTISENKRRTERREDDDDSYDQTDDESSEEGWEGELLEDSGSSPSASSTLTSSSLKEEPKGGSSLPKTASLAGLEGTSIAGNNTRSNPSSEKEEGKAQNNSPQPTPASPKGTELTYNPTDLLSALLKNTPTGSGSKGSQKKNSDIPPTTSPQVGGPAKLQLHSPPSPTFHKATPTRQSPRPSSANPDPSPRIDTKPQKERGHSTTIACYQSSIVSPPPSSSVKNYFIANQRSQLPSSSASTSSGKTLTRPDSFNFASPTNKINLEDITPKRMSLAGNTQVPEDTPKKEEKENKEKEDIGVSKTQPQKELNEPKPMVRAHSNQPKYSSVREPQKPARKPNTSPSVVGTKSQSLYKRASSNPSLNSDQQQQQKLRALVFDELVKTEQDYVQDLLLTSKVFYMPLKAHGYLDARQISILFSNLTMLLGVSNELLKDLEKENAIDSVGTTFCFMMDFLKLYAVYCTNHPEAVLLLESCRKNNSKFDSFLKEQQENPICRGLPFNGFLIKPVQRVTKYPLLLKQFRNYTEPTHADYEAIEMAITRCENILSDINSYQIVMENHHRLMQIKENLPGADSFIDVNVHNFLQEDLVKEAVLSIGQEEATPATKRMFYILLNTMLIRAIPKKRNLNVYSTTLSARTLTKKYIYDKLRIVQVIPLSNITGVSNIEDNEATDIKNAFHLLYKKPKELTDVKLFVMASSPIQKTDWMKRLNNIANPPKNRDSMQRIAGNSETSGSIVKSIW